MRLGLITDIHEHVPQLRDVLNRLQAEHVDRVLVLGDVCDMGLHLVETCQLLAEAEISGVWGNHDFGFCAGTDSALASRFPASVLRYMESLRPQLEIDGCLFTHIEPWLNPELLDDLWYYDGRPDNLAKCARIFNAVPHRVIFAGHYHVWMALTPEGPLSWDGSCPIRLDQGRYFVVLGAVCDGCCAVFDTETSELRPFQAESTYSRAG